MTYKSILIALCCIAASACASTRRDQSVALARLLPFQPTEVLHADPGDVLFTQQAVVTDVVRSEGLIAEHFPAPGIFGVPIRIEEGEQLFRVYFREDETARVYCSPRNVRDVLREQYIKSCASDDDNDQDFDRVWMMRIVEGKSRVIGGTMTGSTEVLSPSVPYVQLESHDIAPVTIAVRYMNTLGGTPLLSVYMIEDGEPQMLGLRDVTKRGRTYPEILNVYGARIELLGRSEATLQYRVLNGFPEGEPFPLVLLWQSTIYMYIP